MQKHGIAPAPARSKPYSRLGRFQRSVVDTAWLVFGVLCGAFLALAIPTTYWFYTIPKRYRENRKRLAHLVEK